MEKRKNAKQSRTAPKKQRRQTKPKRSPVKTRDGNEEKVRLSTKQVIYFTEELSDMLSADIQIYEALDSISKRETGDEVREVAEKCRDEVGQGTKLAQALRDSSNGFSELYCRLVQAGEVGGGLPDILRRQVSYLKTMADLKARLITALVYPAFLIGFGLLVSGMFIFYLIPRLEQVVESNGGQLPFMAKAFLQLGEILKSYWLPLILGSVALLALGVWLIQSPVYRRKWDEFKLKIPLVGSLLKTRFNVQYSETLANLLENGIPLLDALRLVEGATDNEYIRDRLGVLVTEHAEGEKLYAAMTEADIFEPGMVDMVRVGHRTGALAQALARAGQRLDREFENSIERIGAFIQPVILLIMAVLVGAMAFTMVSLINETISALR